MSDTTPAPMTTEERLARIETGLALLAQYLQDVNTTDPVMVELNRAVGRASNAGPAARAMALAERDEHRDRVQSDRAAWLSQFRDVFVPQD